MIKPPASAIVTSAAATETPVISKACVWLVALTAFIVVPVVLAGVPIVTLPAPVIVVKSKPLPATTLVTVPIPKPLGKLVNKLPSKAGNIPAAVVCTNCDTPLKVLP